MKKKWICLLTALALVVGVCAVKPVISGAAPVEPVDVDQPCTLNISVPADLMANQKYWEDMNTAGMVVDLYKVADAEKVAGYDTYSLKPEEGYGSLQISKYSDLQEMDAAAWDDMAQQAARVALDEDNPTESNWSCSVTDKGASFADLDPGLYLAVTRGGDLQFPAYTKEVDWEVKEGEGDTATVTTVKRFATIANSARYEYSFLPQLIALPTKAANENGEISTANRGPWLYSMSTFLKSGRTDRYGSLRIIKTLSEFESEAGIAKPEPTTFVFEIMATLPTGENDSAGNPIREQVFHTFESISFTAGGTESVTIDHIPATADVTVKEVYSGSSYEVSGSDVQDGITITADDVVDAPFTNVYNENRKKGYGIKNQFDFNGDTWVHSPITPDDEQDRPSLRPGTGTTTQPGGGDNQGEDQTGPGEGEQIPPAGQGTETPGQTPDQNVNTQPDNQPIE